MVITLLYYSSTLFFSFLTVFRRKYGLYIIPIVFLILFLFSALRTEGVSRDYEGYYERFSKLVNNVDYFESAYMYFEPSLYFIPLFTKVIYQKLYVELSFVVFAFLGVLFKLRSFEYSNSFFLSVFLYISSWFALHEMTQIRAGVACGILLISLKHVYDRNLLKFLLLLFCACLFHYSALIFFLVYFFNGKTISVKIYASVLIISLALVGMKIDFLALALSYSNIPKLQDYTLVMSKGVYTEINVFNVLFIVNFLVTLLLLFKVKHLVTYNKYAILFTKILVLGNLFYLLFSAVPVLAMRVSELFTIIQILLYPSIIFLFRNKVIGYLFVIFLCLLTSYNTYFISILVDTYKTWI